MLHWESDSCMIADGAWQGVDIDVLGLVGGRAF